MLIRKTCTSNSFAALPRLHATAVDCAHELMGGESGIGAGWQGSPGLVSGECWMGLGWVTGAEWLMGGESCLFETRE